MTTGSERFHELLDEIGELHDKKQSDYGRPTDPFANVRASEDFGVEGWVGALVRANDKMRRLQKAAQGGTLANEGVVDSLMDLAVYALIALVLYEEGEGESTEIDWPTSVSGGGEAITMPPYITFYNNPVDEWEEWEPEEVGHLVNQDHRPTSAVGVCACGRISCPWGSGGPV